MSLSLAPGLSFCEARGQRVFLDLNENRYFCLGTAADAAFDDLLSGFPVSEHLLERLQVLKRAGILMDSTLDEIPRRCRAPNFTRSPLDQPSGGNSGIVRTLNASWAIQRAKLELQMFSLATVCGRISAAKRRMATHLQPGGQQQLADLASAFAMAGRIVATLDHCLPVAVAMTRQCLNANIDVSLCIGVKAQPFEAHAWVAAGETVVSDRLETVRSFTPVLIL